VLHARTFCLSDFVSIENKGPEVFASQAGNTGSIPVARSITYLKNRRINKGAMINRNSDKELNERLTGISRQTDLIYRPLALTDTGTINE
jgi:hypothetical protein